MRTQRSSPLELALAALVADRRAGERALDVALHLVERVGRQEILQRVAEQVVGRDADPVAERLVGEAQPELRGRSRGSAGRRCR